MSNAALEAMEAGLPLLLTRCGGIDNYVDSSIGWVCEPYDVEELYAALCRMFEAPDADLLAMGQRARALVEREFEIGIIGHRNAELLAEVVRRRGGT
jgi:glycosyltransferase involved in cell wall biosynthesis